MRRSLSISVGVVVLTLLAGCGSPDEKKTLTSKDPSSSAPTSDPTTAPTSAPTSTAPPTPTPTTPAGPLTQAQYQTALIRLDQRLAGDINALGTVKTEDSLDAALENLTQTLNAESLALGSIKPPARAVAANRVLQLRLKAASTAMSQGDTSDIGCGGLAYVAQSLQRQLNASLNVAVVQLRTLGLIFGRTLPDLGPEPAASRPSNGDILVRTGPGGPATLRIKNGKASDVAIAIVNTGKLPSKPQVLVYVQAKKTTKVFGIGGSYQLYFKTGKDWNPKRRQFSSDCAFSKFDTPFAKNKAWEIELQAAVGNVTASNVDPF